MPRAGAGPYPSPAALGSSPRDPDVASLPGLVELKLRAGRHRDIADVVELLKRIDDAHCIDLEARVPPALRSQLSDLRRDALEEIANAGR